MWQCMTMTEKRKVIVIVMVNNRKRDTHNITPLSRLKIPRLRKLHCWSAFLS